MKCIELLVLLQTNQIKRLNSGYFNNKDSISTYAKSIKSKKKKGPNGQVKEEDIENLIEKNSFPCQYNDFTNLTFELDGNNLLVINRNGSILSNFLN